MLFILYPLWKFSMLIGKKETPSLFQGSGLAKDVFQLAAEVMKDKYITRRNRSSIRDL